MSVAALLTVFTKAEVIVIAEHKARKLRHNKHVEVPFLLNRTFPVNPAFMKTYSVFASKTFGHMWGECPRLSTLIRLPRPLLVYKVILVMYWSCAVSPRHI